MGKDVLMSREAHRANPEIKSEGSKLKTYERVGGDLLSQEGSNKEKGTDELHDDDLSEG